MLIEFCQENTLVIANTLFQKHKRRLYTWTSPDGQHRNQIDYIFAAKDGEALYSQQKQDWELTVVQIMNSLLPNSAVLLYHISICHKTRIIPEVITKVYVVDETVL